MLATEILDEALTLTEAVDLAEGLGHSLDRSNLTRYAAEGRLVARKSGGTWLTTRAALRDLVVALEAESRGRPRKIHLGKRTLRYTRTPELVQTLGEIQRARTALRSRKLSATQEARIWQDLTARAVYHTNRMEGNPLTFDEAAAVIAKHRQTKSHAPRRPDTTDDPARP